MTRAKNPAGLLLVGSAAAVLAAIVYLINSMTRGVSAVGVRVTPAVPADAVDQSLRAPSIDAETLTSLSGGDRAFAYLPLVVTLLLIGAVLFLAYLQLSRNPSTPWHRALFTPGALGVAIACCFAALSVAPALATVATTIVALNVSGLTDQFQPVFSVSWAWLASAALYYVAMLSHRAAQGVTQDAERRAVMARDS